MERPECHWWLRHRRLWRLRRNGVSAYPRSRREPSPRASEHPPRPLRFRV